MKLAKQGLVWERVKQYYSTPPRFAATNTQVGVKSYNWLGRTRQKVKYACISMCNCAFHLIQSFNPFPNDKFYSSKLKEVADDNFQLNENGRNGGKVSK